MNTIEIANQLVELCKEGKNIESLDTLFAEDAVSVEAAAMPTMPQELRGIDAIKGKNQWWFANHEVHSASVTGPWTHGDKFIVGFHFDVTNKVSEMRMEVDEVALYYVEDGMIVREEFFYGIDM
jgi:SnoaL-like domain